MDSPMAAGRKRTAADRKREDVEGESWDSDEQNGSKTLLICGRSNEFDSRYRIYTEPRRPNQTLAVKGSRSKGPVMHLSCCSKVVAPNLLDSI